jgi:6-pyruvoyltetrahydropterin/6-carboxytetrahydropterin synthase
MRGFHCESRNCSVSRLAIIELHKEELKFSAGHFMLFSAAERETMHGHDYQIHVAFHTLIHTNGMAFDCRVYKQKLLDLCQTLDYRFILPAHSDFLRLEETAERWTAYVGTETFAFYKKDVAILPICNVTIEELSHWFLQQLIQNQAELQEHHIQGITIRVFNGRGESGATSWGKV